MEHYFAPMEGLTDSVYRRLHYKYFGGVDRYYMPFLSPTIHRALTPREARELPPAENHPFTAIPQLLTKVAEDFLWAAKQCRDLGYKEGDFPVAEYNAAHEVSLPLYYGMTDEQISYVIDSINRF